MVKIKKCLFIFLLSIPFFLLSCSQGEKESAIAKKITLTPSKVAIVLPNDLSDEWNQTCMAGGVTGPRVRLKASIKWVGTEGDLLPLVISLQFKDSRVSGEFAGTVSPGDEGSETLAGSLFGVATDYLPASDTTYAMSTCFLDYGGLPKPVTELKGTAQLEIPATLMMTGVIRDAQGEDTPFVKEVSTTITYVAGSVPIN